MVIRECVWDVCVYISCTGDEGQLGSSFLWSDRGGWDGQGICRKRINMGSCRGLRIT